MKLLRTHSFQVVAALLGLLATERAARADDTPSEGAAASATTLAAAPVIPSETPPEPLPAPLPAPAAAAPPPTTPGAAAPAPVAARPGAGASPLGAAAPSADRPADDDAKNNAVLQPWDVDVRAALHTTPILQYGGIGASADAGMRRLGPGTLALGGGLDYFFCGTTCASSPMAFTQRQISFEGRVTYHLALPKMKNLDFYPLATAGFIVSRSTLTVGDNSEYRASDVAPSVGFGAGASYYFADRFFVGAEARFRYAAGTYSYELASGPSRQFDRSGVDTWSASTVDLSVAFGARF